MKNKNKNTAFGEVEELKKGLPKSFFDFGSPVFILSFPRNSWQPLSQTFPLLMQGPIANF